MFVGAGPLAGLLTLDPKIEGRKRAMPYGLRCLGIRNLLCCCGLGQRAIRGKNAGVSLLLVVLGLAVFVTGIVGLAGGLDAPAAPPAPGRAGAGDDSEGVATVLAVRGEADSTREKRSPAAPTAAPTNAPAKVPWGGDCSANTECKGEWCWDGMCRPNPNKPVETCNYGHCDDPDYYCHNPCVVPGVLCDATCKPRVQNGFDCSADSSSCMPGSSCYARDLIVIDRCNNCCLPDQ